MRGMQLHDSSADFEARVFYVPGLYAVNGRLCCFADLSGYPAFAEASLNKIKNRVFYVHG